MSQPSSLPSGVALRAPDRAGMLGRWRTLNSFIGLSIWQGRYGSGMGRYGSGGRAVVWQSEGCRFDPTLGVSKCPWARHLTPNCFWRAGWYLAWPPIAVDVWMCVWTGEWEASIVQRYINAVHLPFTLLRERRQPTTPCMVPLSHTTTGPGGELHGVTKAEHNDTMREHNYETIDNRLM